MASLPSFPRGLLTAEEAQRKIEYIQAELLRVQRACEYRDEHPYNGTDKQCGAHDAPTQRENQSEVTTPCTGRHDVSEPSLKQVSSSHESYAGSVMSNGRAPAGDGVTPSQPTSNKKGGSGRRERYGTATRCALSFSDFERRRIAQLLGRVAVEIAAVWAYVHRWTSLTEAAAAAAAASGYDCPTTNITISSSTPVNPAQGAARQSSERSVATAAPASDLNVAPQPPPQASALLCGVDDGSAEHRPPFNGWDAVEPTVSPRGAWKEARRGTALNVNPAAQIAALSTLIQTAMSIQQMFGGAGVQHTTAGDTGAASVSKGEAYVVDEARQSENPLSTAAEADITVLNASASLREENSATLTLPPSAELDQTLPASTDAPSLPPPPSLPPSPPAQQQQQQQQHSTASRHSVLPSDMSVAHCPASLTSNAASRRVSIPPYLRAYVLEGSEKAITDAEEKEEGLIDEEDDATVVVVNADRGDSRSISAGSVSGANMRSYSRASDHAAFPNVESRGTTPAPTAYGAEVSLNGHVRVPGAATAAAAQSGNASSIIAHHRLDSDMGFSTSSSPFKRVISGSSLRSSSLVGSPVQAQQYSRPRSRGYSTGSLQSQPLNVGAAHLTNTNNSSSAGRSPDSAEMSPAAAAAYSRSTSLLRRPHRLEVPISRTQSLRRVPSYTSPTSVASSTLPSAAVVAATGAGSSAFYSHAHASSQHAAKGNGGSYQPGLGSSSGGAGGSAQAEPPLASSPPLGVSMGATADSPYSSLVGLHFQRVISVDSENGGWPPGSLADSLEMSQPKPNTLLGRLAAPSRSVNVTPSPAPQEAVGGDLLRAHTANTSTALVMTAGYAPADNLGGASTASSTLKVPYVVPSRADSIRGGSVHSRNLTPYWFSSPVSVGHVRAAAPPPPPPTRTGVSQATATKSTKPGPAGAGPPNRLDNPTSMKAKAAEPNPLPPHSYKIDADKLAAFLQCVRGLVQTEFSEEEFDSLRLFYFLPGVSLLTPSWESPARPVAEGSGESASRPASAASSVSRATAEEAAPLPLFTGGERVLVRLTKLDVFYMLVRKKVQEVCDNVGIPSESFLSLL